MKTCICNNRGTCFGCQIMLAVERHYGHRGTIWLEAVYRAAEQHEVKADTSCLDALRPVTERISDDDV